MSRYEQSYSGDRRTAALHVQLTPVERAQLEAAAAEVGAATLSAFVRVLLFRRLAEAELTAGTRRHPDAPGLMYQLSAIGNNLNQLARIANTTRRAPQEAELKATIGVLKAAMARVLSL